MSTVFVSKGYAVKLHFTHFLHDPSTSRTLFDVQMVSEITFPAFHGEGLRD